MHEYDDLTDRQREIIKVALKIVAAKGASNLTLRDIAKALGVTEAAIYRHFRSKDVVLEELVMRFGQETINSVVDHAAVTGGLDGIKGFVYDRIERVQADPVLANVVLSEELFKDNPERETIIRPVMLEIRARLQVYIVQAKERGEIRCDLDDETLYLMIFGPIRYIVKMWAISGGSFDLKRRFDQFWDAVHIVFAPVGKA